MNRIALGTVQFGLPYGISNDRGRTPLEEVGNILARAKAAEIDMLDTAASYGDSEEVLGAAGLSGWQIITKLPAIPLGCTDINGWIQRTVGNSLLRLKVDNLYAVLLHRPSELLGPHGKQLLKGLEVLRTTTCVNRIGVSVYGPDELISLRGAFTPDIVQLPLNLIDHRFLASGLIDDLKESGTEVHVRSIFLQGLLLMDEDSRPNKFGRWNTVWRLLEDWLKTNSLTPLQACLRFALAHSKVDRVIVGVEDAKQLEQILEAASGILPPMPKELTCSDEQLVNPSFWHSL